jgi:cellulose synthase operon protein C
MAMIGMSIQSWDASAVARKRADLDVDKKTVRSKLVGKKNKKAPAPQLNRSAVFAIEVERKIIEEVQRAVPQLRSTARKLSRGSSGRLNLLERALNLNFELAVFLRNDEERSYDRVYTRWDLQGRRGREPKMNNSKSKKQWKRVIKDSRSLLKEFPRSRNADRLIFYQAMALQQLEKEREAAKIFSQLIEKYPNSRITSDAYSQLGDYYFDRNDFGNAANNYRKVLRYPNSKRYLWSIFKLAWCSFNTGRYRDALKNWQKVVSVARKRRNVEGAIQLRDQALKDMIYAFSELKMVGPAIAYYRRNGGSKFIGSLLTLLSQTFAGNGQFQSAISTLKRYQQLEPFDIDAPATQKEIISLLYALGKLDGVWKELKRFGVLYGPKSRWASVNGKKNLRAVKEAQVMIKNQIITYSKLTHKEAIKVGGVSLHRQARIGYKMFLELYPKSKENPEILYNLADIEYFLKDYRKSGFYYLSIVRLGPQKAIIFKKKSKNEPIHKKSAKYMIESFAKVFSSEFLAMQKTKPNFKKKSRPLSKDAVNYLAACAEFIKYYGKDRKIVKTCDLDATKIFYQTSNLKKSQQYLRVVAMKYPNAPEGAASVRKLIGLYAGEDRKVIALAEELLKIPAYSKGTLGRELRGLRTNLEITSIEKISDTSKKAKQYEAKARKYPKNRSVDKLWFNAGVNYAKAGDVQGTIRAYSFVVKSFPKFEQANLVVLDLAKIFERQLDFVSAVRLYRKYARSYAKKTKEIAGAQAKVCELTMALNAKKAEASCLTFASKFPAGGTSVVERLVMQAGREGRISDMVRLIRTNLLPMISSDGSLQIKYLYQIYRKGKGGVRGTAIRDMVTIANRNRGKISGEALRYVSEVKFKQTDQAIGKFSKIKLQGGTVERLQKSIEAKANALVQLQNSYQSVVDLKDPYWGVGALYRMGVAFELLANDLRKPPAIQGEKPEEVAKILEPQAAAQIKTALDYFQSAENTVYKFKVFNRWTPLVIHARNRLSLQKSGKRYSVVPFNEFYPSPEYIGSNVSKTVAKRVR